MELGLYKPVMLIAIVFFGAILTESFTLGQVNVEPNTALLNEGERTELLCRYGRSIQYCRIEIPGEKVLILSPEWSKSTDFAYYGAGLAAGQCGVSIKRVKAINNGQVRCTMGVEGEELLGTIDLVVALRPQQPLIELLTKTDREGNFVEGSNFAARCSVRNGRPAANITWLIDNYPADKRVSQLKVDASTTESNVSLATTSQEIQWHLGPEDNKRKLICRSHHQTDRENVPPQEAAYLMLVRFAPVRQPEALVYGLYLDHTATVNVTIRANPAPVVEWTIDGAVIPQSTQNGRFAVSEPQYLGHDYYNVTMTIGGLTLEDTTKTYLMRASNALGATDYQVRISSSATPPSAGLDVGAIVGIIVAVAVLLIIVLLIVFARVTGRWCFGGKSVKTPTNETSDTESADLKATSTATITTTAAASETLAPSVEATTTKKSKRLPSFTAMFKRFNERDAHKNTADSDAAVVEELAEGTSAAANSAANDATDGNDNEPKEDKQLVYAELVLKPTEHNNEPPKPKSSTEYAEIVYVQKPSADKGKK